MSDDEKHYSGGADAEKAAAEQAQAEAQAKADAEAAEKAKAEEEAKAKAEADAKAAEDAKATEGEDDNADPDPDTTTKKRSIYDDAKEDRQKRRAAEDAAAAEKARADAAEQRVVAAEKTAKEAEVLLKAKDEAKTPEQKREAANDIKDWANKHSIDGADAIEELAGIIAKRTPSVELPLTKEEADEWRAERAKSKQAGEDMQVRTDAAAPVKDHLPAISDDAERDAVMNEVVRLSHTKEFHDKDVDYIVYKNREALGKLVSPKKKSFEEGGVNRPEGDAGTLDYSTGRGVTPDALTKEMHQTRSIDHSSFEIRRVV